MMTIIIRTIRGDVSQDKATQHKCNKAYRRESEEGSVGWWDATCGMQKSFERVRWMDVWGPLSILLFIRGAGEEKAGLS